jgi:splicing factor 1
MRGLTGTNSLPVASTRRFRVEDSTTIKQEVSDSNNYHRTSSGVLIKPDDIRGRSAHRDNDEVPKKRKRGNRWGDSAASNAVANLVGLPTAIFTHMTSEQLEAYSIHVRISEITQKLKINDIVPSERLRYVHTLTSPHDP